MEARWPAGLGAGDQIADAFGVADGVEVVLGQASDGLGHRLLQSISLWGSQDDPDLGLNGGHVQRTGS